MSPAPSKLKENAMNESNKAVDGIARNVEQVVAGAHQAMDKAVDSASDVLRPAIDHLVAGVHEAVEHLASFATQASGKLELTDDQVKQAQTRMLRSAQGYVREKPLTSLGIAVAAGFLVGWALRLR